MKLSEQELAGPTGAITTQVQDKPGSRISSGPESREKPRPWYTLIPGMLAAPGYVCVPLRTGHCTRDANTSRPTNIIAPYPYEGCPSSGPPRHRTPAGAGSSSGRDLPGAEAGPAKAEGTVNRQRACANATDDDNDDGDDSKNVGDHDDDDDDEDDASRDDDRSSDMFM